jgi:hypothetical protein
MKDETKLKKAISAINDLFEIEQGSIVSDEIIRQINWAALRSAYLSIKDAHESVIEIEKAMKKYS